jgi:hypothetical protein
MSRICCHNVIRKSKSITLWRYSCSGVVRKIRCWTNTTPGVNSNSRYNKSLIALAGIINLTELDWSALVRIFTASSFGFLWLKCVGGVGLHPLLEAFGHLWTEGRMQREVTYDITDLLGSIIWPHSFRLIIMTRKIEPPKPIIMCPHSLYESHEHLAIAAFWVTYGAAINSAGPIKVSAMATVISPNMMNQRWLPCKLMC